MMDIIISALGQLADPTVLLFLLAGVVIGIIIGVIPGLGGRLLVHAANKASRATAAKREIG